MGKKLFIRVTFIFLLLFGLVSFVPTNGAIVSGTIKPSYYNLWNPGWMSAGPVDFEIADDGYVYQVGNSEDPRITQNYTFHLLKWSPTAEIVWNRTWDRSDHTQIYGLAVHNSFIYTAGLISTESGIKSLLVKWSSNGDILWSRTWSWTTHQRALDVDVDQHGNVFVLCGVFDLNETAIQYHFALEVLLKYDNSGTLLGNYSGGFCYGRDMKLRISDSGFIYAFDPYYLGLTQWNSSGVVQWNSFEPIQLYDVSPNGNYIVATPPGYTIRKIDPNQNEIWNTTDTIIWQEYYGSLDLCGSLDAANDGSIYLLYKIRNTTAPTMILNKYDAEGHQLWNKTLGVPGTWDNEFATAFAWARGLDVSNQGVLYVSAYFYDGEDLSMGLVVYGTPTLAMFQPELFVIIGFAGILCMVVLIIVLKKRQA